MSANKPAFERGMISVITPVKNGARYIAEAVESVLAQGYAPMEHIVVDGGSGDGTLEVLARYPHLKVVSRPDDGLYEAVNLGLSLAQGEIIGHLNSDDIYAPGALGLAAAALAAAPEAESLCGGVEFFAEGPDGRSRVVERRRPPADGSLPLVQVTRGSPVINARFFRRSLYDRVGVYDARYRLAGDREFLLRAWLAGMRGLAVDALVYRYRLHGDSLTLNRRPGLAQPWRLEHLGICREHLDRPGLPPDARRECLRWHAWELALETLRALDERRPGAAWRQAREGARWDRLWPVRGAWLAARRLLRGPAAA